MKRLHHCFTALTLMIGVVTTPAMAQTPNPYEGFKVPPLEVPSEARYTHEFIEILGSKHRRW